MTSTSLTQSRLKELVSYDPVKGEFTRIARSCRFATRSRIGAVAGTLDSHGYRQIRVQGRTYLAHRLAFFYMTGNWPAQEGVDHIDGRRDNNSWSNLRESSMERNKENMKQATSRNVIGLLGVSQKGKKFQAQISGKAFGKKYLGLYPTAEAAHAAYLAAKRLLHAGCTI